MSGTARVANSRNLQDWLALHLVPGMGPVTCNKLVGHFGGPDKVLAAGISDLAAVCRLRQESVRALSAAGRQNLAALASAEIEKAAKSNIAIIACDDPLYPALLKNIHDPPAVLYVLGDPEVLSRKALGIVGSRAATHYGRSIAANLASNLARQGFAIVSGMALGIDTAAHKGALAAAGKTIAVLGCGLDIVYPPGNHKLYDDIAVSGALVSEYPLGTMPENFRFPARNRILSGLTLGVVVVEATIRSGSLITARHALEQDREVFAVPGRIDSVKSAGTHTLLQQGAKLVHGVNDIVEEFSYQGHRYQEDEAQTEDISQGIFEQLNAEEAALLACLDVYPRPIDEIVRESGFAPRKTNELLLLLELRGIVRALPGKCYQRASGVPEK
jgi:DNA processing protein